MAHARRRSTAGPRSAQPMGSPRAAFVPAGTAGRANACHWRCSVRSRAKQAACSARRLLTQWLWRGRSVKLVDGTGISMPDTPENQERYPQPRTQAPGVGFPLARLVMVICLATLPVVKGSACPRPPENQDTWSRLGAKVSAIPAKVIFSWARRRSEWRL